LNSPGPFPPLSQGTSLPSFSIKRRSLLKGATALLVANFIAGCQGQRTPDAIIQLLQNSIPTALLREFQTAFPSEVVQFRVAETLASLYATLTADSNEPTGLPANLSTLGDYWLTRAIRDNQIAPLDSDQLEGWENLPSIFKELVTRDRAGMPTSTGQLWGAPYRWGSLAMIYQVEAFNDLGWAPTDWSDLWKPELKHHFSLPDSPRIVIALALKQLSQSLNAETINGQSISQHEKLKAVLQDLHQQVKLYSSSDYLQPLILGDTWLAVGWSTDILPLLRRDRRFAGVIPASGTALTADIWVQPQPSEAQPSSPSGNSTPPSSPSTGNDASANTAASSVESIINEWIGFCWEPTVAQRLSLQGFAASPMLMTGDRQSLPASLREDNVLLPTASVFDNSEFLLPLPDSVLQDYQEVWQALRQGQLQQAS
jgi:putative spermidine/putrescine transport system substrate-binding protein